jgi:hypothetical protein
MNSNESRFFQISLEERKSTTYSRPVRRVGGIPRHLQFNKHGRLMEEVHVISDFTLNASG